MMQHVDRDRPVGGGVRASRRQVLSFAGLVIGTGLVEFAGPATPAAATPPAPDLTLEPIANDAVTVLSGESAAVGVCPRQLAVKVVNSGVELPSGTRIELTFDPRLYALMERPLVWLGSRPVPAGSEIATDPHTGAHTYTITLREPVPSAKPGQDALIVVVGTAHTSRYPRDLVRHAIPATAEMPATSRSPQRATSLQSATAAGSQAGRLPWGIELSGVWRRHAWVSGSAFRYFVPVRITLRGVGPGAVPAPASFTVTLDPQLVREIAITSVRLNGKPHHGTVRRLGVSRTTAAYQTRWRTPARLNDGDVMDIGLHATLLTPPGAVPAIKHPVVVLDPMDGDMSQRRTGLETFTRIDSIWQ